MISSTTVSFVVLAVSTLFGGSKGEAAQSAIAAASSFAAVAAAIIAWKSYTAATRPNVIAFFECADDYDSVFFTVMNTGNSPAFHISLLFSRPLPVPREDVDSLTGGFVGLGIPMLAPGDKRTTYINTSKAVDDAWPDGVATVYVYYSNSREKPAASTPRGEFTLDAYSFYGMHLG